MVIFTEQQDLEAEIAMLRARSDVNERYIFLLGNSQGGVVSALTAGLSARNGVVVAGG